MRNTVFVTIVSVVEGVFNTESKDFANEYIGYDIEQDTSSVY